MLPFGRLLLEALQRKQLSQSAFARQVGVPRSVISEIARGRRKPPVRLAVEWMAELGVPSSDHLAWRRAVALARADPMLADWIHSLEEEVDRLRRAASCR